MTKFSIASLFVFLSLRMLVSCGNNTNSGPCDYTQEKFNMRIIDVSEDPHDKNMYIVLVDFDGNIEYAEGTHTFAEIRDVKTDVDFVVRNHIEEGNIYTGTVHKKVEGTGNCEDQIIDWDQKLKK
ncbi:hypothetical protein KFE94_15855 [bacterium SCSIO 12643]|nr:hypothetical protein KFE94_15855 [bacterium SCSIO 12643]